MMAIRDAAKDAWVAARSSREEEARLALAITLDPFDVEALETVDVEVTDTYTLFAFHDPKDDVCLAARTRGKDWDVYVVEWSDGWTMQGPAVKSLAHLHEVLPEPAPEPDAPNPWTEGVTYQIGDRVTFEGSTWEAVQGDGAGNNVWRPGSGGYSWQEVTG